MLPKSKRLNLKKDFKEMVSGQRFNSGYFTLYIKHSEDIDPKIGVALAKKNFKSAVLRNKAKRICFQIFQNHYSNLRRNINLVIMPKAAILEKPLIDVEKELLNVKGLFDIN